MHDGRFATLEEVVDHYAKGGTASPGRSPLVRGFAITEAEKRDLVEFLKSLTDEELLRNPELSDPFRVTLGAGAQRASARTNPAPLKHIEAPAPRPESGSDSARSSGRTSPPYATTARAAMASG